MAGLGDFQSKWAVSVLVGLLVMALTRAASADITVLTLNPTGLIAPGGKAVISGTVTCADPLVRVEVSLSQSFGRGGPERANSGGGELWLGGTGLSQAWSVTIPAADHGRPFHPGVAFINVIATSFDLDSSAIDQKHVGGNGLLTVTLVK
jgi:hypothetical protein